MCQLSQIASAAFGSRFISIPIQHFSLDYNPGCSDARVVRGPGNELMSFCSLKLYRAISRHLLNISATTEPGPFHSFRHRICCGRQTISYSLKFNTTLTLLTINTVRKQLYGNLFVARGYGSEENLPEMTLRETRVTSQLMANSRVRHVLRSSVFVRNFHNSALF